MVDIGDAIFILQFLFGNGPAIPLPFPDPGVDATADALTCDEYAPGS
jgi:hypothetical protein